MPGPELGGYDKHQAGGVIARDGIIYFAPSDAPQAPWICMDLFDTTWTLVACAQVSTACFAVAHNGLLQGSAWAFTILLDFGGNRSRQSSEMVCCMDLYGIF